MPAQLCIQLEAAGVLVRNYTGQAKQIIAPAKGAQPLKRTTAAESPLATVLAAGAGALPKKHKLINMLTPGVVAEMRNADQLPLELDLGPEFVFHPIFACPVSRNQSTPDNPHMLLPCGHVPCEQSVLKIAKSSTRVFKCPYCPVETSVPRD